MASTVLVLFSSAGVIAIIVGVPLMLAVAPSLTQQIGEAADVTAFLLVMLGNLAITLPLSVFPSILDGLDRYAVKSLVRLVFLALRTTAVIIAVNQNCSLLPLAVIFSISNIAEHAAMAVLAFRFLPGLRLRISLVDRGSFHEIRRYSIDAFLAMLAGRITLQAGVILLGLFLPMSQIAVFATASRLIEYAKTLLRTITATLTPGVSALEARGDWDGIRSLFLNATRFVLYLVLPVQVGLWFFGTPFLVRWVPEIGAQGSLPLMILSLSLTLSVAQSAASRLLYGLGRLKIFARLALGEAALNAVLLIALIPWLGLTGAAVAIAIPNVAFCAAVIVHTLGLLNLKRWEYLRTWARPLLAAVAPAIVWLFLPAAAADWRSIFQTAAWGLAPYAAAVLILEGFGSRVIRLSARISRRIPQWSSRR